MPGKDHIDAPAGEPGAGQEATRPSRRRVLAGAAGAGAAGVAATMLTGFGGADAAAAAERDRAAGTGATGAGADSDGPVVAHVRNARTGEIDVFRGTSEVRLHDADLAARIVRASGASADRTGR